MAQWQQPAMECDSTNTFPVPLGLYDKKKWRRGCSYESVFIHFERGQGEHILTYCPIGQNSRLQAQRRVIERAWYGFYIMITCY